MFAKPRTWFLISALCLLGAIVFWELGRRQEKAGQTPAPAPQSPGQSQATGAPAPLLSRASPTSFSYVATNAFPEPKDSRYPHRLRNTPTPLSELLHSDDALLLANALLDLRRPLELAVPAGLRPSGEVGSFVVQSRGKITDDFRGMLSSIGAEIVSYVPNNALLVRVSSERVERISTLPNVRSVLPWLPYFKLSPGLLGATVESREVPQDAILRVTVYSSELDRALTDLGATGFEVLSQQRSPFGVQLMVRLGTGEITALARLDRVQWIERAAPRKLMNDLAGLTLNTMTNSGPDTQYLGLTGKGVRVNVNDTGVANHPDLPDVVHYEPFTQLDLIGHGTHVAGIIASTGANGPSPAASPDLIPGSATNANFRGKAPEATIFALAIDLCLGSIQSDEYLQETAAANGAFISNNSWGYVQNYEYDSSAASFDAAVRDALPGKTGSQPIAYVFAAANDGGGSDDGTGGTAGTITSPGTAKNVITVGALESLRKITNTITFTNILGETQTNAPFLAKTDSDNQVAGYSSRGNVGIGVEGDFGRFKPDVVAPGSFIISTRPPDWKDPNSDREFVGLAPLRNEVVAGNATNYYAIEVGDNSVGLAIRVAPNNRSPRPFPPLLIGERENDFPPPNDHEGTNFVSFGFTGSRTSIIAIVNQTNIPVSFDLIGCVGITNDIGIPGYFDELKKLNARVGPLYRYESGTSMATPAVAGLLALVQDYYGKGGSTNLDAGLALSPALMKALLINSTETVSPHYDRNVRSSRNLQGWGVPSIARMIPPALGDSTIQSNQWPILMYDQSPARALATDQSFSRTVTINTNSLEAQASGLKITLVWTDPPGNPAVGVKLVNDLDLIVTNRADGTIYWGNHIVAGSSINQASDTNSPPNDDVVNNVENVFISAPSTGPYDVVVIAKRVNVNAVTDQTNSVLQDFALVVSTSDNTLKDTFQPSPPPETPVADVRTNVVLTLTNGAPLLDQRVGANSSLAASTNGEQRQWRFYKFVNEGSTNPYVAIITMLPSNLSRPRLSEPDLDLYVSTDEGLLRLDDATLEKAIKAGQVPPTAETGSARSRLGGEFVTFSNSPPDSTYFIAVKSEDQMAGEFSVIAIATDKPFSELGKDGCVRVRFLPLPAPIPDGSNQRPEGLLRPGVSTFLGVGTLSTIVRSVTVTNILEHEDFGDVTSLLIAPNRIQANLFSHNFLSLTPNERLTFGIDDTRGPRGRRVYRSEGPIHLSAMAGQSTFGVWQYAIYDNAPFHTGLVHEASLCIRPEDLACFTTTGCPETLCAGEWSDHVINLPPDAIGLQICILSNTAPLDVYLREGLTPPNQVEFDYYQRVSAPDGEDCLVVDTSSFPPLQPGAQYRLGIFNPNAFCVDYFLSIRIIRDSLDDPFSTFVYTNAPVPIIDDAVTNAGIFVASSRLIGDVRVGVRLDHERASDLAVHVVSPSGTRWLLTENRGGPRVAADGYGYTLSPVPPNPTQQQILDSYSWATFTDSTNLADVMMKFATPPFHLQPPAPFPVLFQTDFDATTRRFYLTNEVFDGWKVLTNQVAVTNDWMVGSGHSNVLALSNGRVGTTLGTIPERQYYLRFAYRSESSCPTQQIAFPVGPVIPAGYLPPDPAIPLIAPAVVTPKLRVVAGQEVRVTVPRTALASVSPTDIVRAIGAPAQPFFRGLPRFALVGQWASSATLLATQTAWGQPFFVGTNALLRAPQDPGDYYLWLAINDPDYRDNTGQTNFPVTVQWKPSQLNQLEMILQGVRRTFTPLDFWQTNITRFVGIDEDHDLQFFSDWNTTTLLDNIEVFEPISAEYYLAEEPLFPVLKADSRDPANPVVEFPSIKGENSYGGWSLDVQDLRAGAPGTSSKTNQILSWYLQFRFLPEQRPTFLTNCVDLVSSVQRGGARFFAVNVPREATFATNSLTSLTNADLLFFFNSERLPELVATELINPGAVIPVTLQGPRSVAPGGVYYLAVRNLDGTVPFNPFDIRLDLELPMVTLTNARPVTAFGRNLAGITTEFKTSPAFLASTNLLYPGTNMHWYKYTVNPSPTLEAVTFELHSTNQDLHLVTRRSLPVVDYLPKPTLFDYHSVNFDIANDVVIVRSNSFPVPLTATPWLLGVYNSGTNGGWYDVRVTRWTNDPPFLSPLPGFSIDTNWNAVTNITGFSLAPGEALNYFYRFQSAPTNSALLFELLNISADVDLSVRRSDLPSPYIYDLSDLQYGTNTEHVAVSTNLYLPTFGSPTNWYINLVNHDSIVATGLLRVATASASNFLVSGLPLELDPVGIAAGGGLIIRWRAVPGQKYEVRISDNPLGPFDTVVAVIVATTSTAEYTDPNPPIPPTTRFYRVVQVP
ncbi:MAG: S8 family serine peptidase [Verrucomicrobia bacterium]|nr:S8 family serine peptidase [Verrucomicrobiota bacterium]MBI3869959.1 S8 family serine peptidase [Verrucomicrobiota bacterium]